MTACAVCVGVCRAVAPLEMRLDCRVAAFGRYLPQIDQFDGSVLAPPPILMRALAPPERERLACEPLTKEGGIYRNACVIVDRGGCAFQDKVRFRAYNALLFMLNSSHG